MGSIDNVRFLTITDTTIEIRWDADFPQYEIDYRTIEEKEWHTIFNVVSWENPYNIIMLKPGTTYEFRIRGLSVPNADCKDKKDLSQIAESPVIKASTLKEPVIKRFSELSLYPSYPILEGRTYPCIESYKGSLWYTDAKFYLYKLDTDEKKVLWKSENPMIEWPLSLPLGYMGLPDITLYDDKLWVTCNIQATHHSGYTVTQSRQYLFYYDFATENISTPVIVEPTRSEYGSWEGGVQAWRGKLWVMHMDVWLEGDLRRTRIVLRTFENGEFSKPIIYENCPTVYPYGPSMSLFNDNLIILFSDLAAEEKGNEEPLLYTVFDGKSFSEVKVIQNIGRSRYARGVQIGTRFLCAYKCSAPYFKKFNYEYHDIALSLFTPSTEEEPQTIMYINDRKYNSSPDIALHGGKIFVVYNKLEHLYDRPEDPAIHHGAWLGSILPLPEER
ncbi:MAG: fibronectin type III domain-containing protein [Candidatus Ratteibacteria bacterium]